MQPDFLPDRVPFLAGASRLFCFARSYFGGMGFDASIWWEGDTGCRHRVMRTGEVGQYEPARTIEDVSIIPSELERVMRVFGRTAIADIKSQPEMIVLANSDAWYGFKPIADVSAHWVFVRCSKHADKRLLEVFNAVEELSPNVFPPDDDEDDED